LVPSLQATSTWANGAGYEPAAVATFLQDADYYLVAHAHAHHHVVVTHEVVAHSTKKIKIPNACLGVGARYVTPFEMLRVERARFVIAS
jgi:L-ascorbate metabolism protein UlaG (beta-lactamase superfamily)